MLMVRTVRTKSEFRTKVKSFVQKCMIEKTFKTEKTYFACSNLWSRNLGED